MRVSEGWPFHPRIVRQSREFSVDGHARAAASSIQGARERGRGRRSDVPFNQAIFNIVVTRVLDRLYTSFPLSISIDHRALMWEALKDAPISDGDSSPEERSFVAESVADATMEWMLLHDYFTGETTLHRGDYFLNRNTHATEVPRTRRTRPPPSL
jgi:hypothetical protein